MRQIYIKKKSGFGNYITTLLFIAVIIGGGFVIFSPEFEQNKPKIQIPNKIFWNLKTNLEVTITDDTGIKFYKIIYKTKSKEMVLNSKVLSKSHKQVTLGIEAPFFDIFDKEKDGTLYIEATDDSKWNYLGGNKAYKKVDVIVDTHEPIVNILAQSKYIRRGGSAVVIVKVKDKNLEDAYISFNDKIRFELTPFYKDTYYIALIAWNMSVENFKYVNLMTSDKAKNQTITKIPLYIAQPYIKEDKIKISDYFIRNISSNVLLKSSETVPDIFENIFIKQNKQLRQKNIDAIRKASIKYMNKNMVFETTIKKFKRLQGSAKKAGYAERRSYIYNRKKIDEEWHLGIDWASIKNARIKASNDGIVIFNEYLGIYGNTVIMDHGLGLMSLYAHLSKSNVEVNEKISVNQTIGFTGTTGAVLGDHLHFGILVQGIEVNPVEWMDRRWIKRNLYNVIKTAKNIIDNDK